jgi:hypothetical protein
MGSGGTENAKLAQQKAQSGFLAQKSCIFSSTFGFCRNVPKAMPCAAGTGHLLRILYE